MKPSSRAVGEPGIGAEVAKDPPHDQVVQSLRQDRASLARISGISSLLDGASAIAMDWFCQNRSPSLPLITAFSPGITRRPAELKMHRVGR